MIAIVLGYLAGSVPFAYLLARRAGIDVRTSGSRNVGAANVLRTTGPGRGVAVMALDMTKGAGAVVLAQLAGESAMVTAAAGLAAVIGHIYPVWLRFHGGKGVAVAGGAFGVLAPVAMLWAATLFILVVTATRFVSLGSVAATVALPPMAWASGAPAPTVAAASATAALIVFRHRGNLYRLCVGTEPRMRRGPADAVVSGDRA